MTDFSPSGNVPARAGHVSALAPRARATLSALRMAALRCRAAARLELPGAVAMLGARPEAATGEAAAEAMVRTLAQGLGRRPRFYRPGSPDLSLDEAWLVSLVEAMRRGDRPSTAFLIQSRVPVAERRPVLFLVRQIADGRVHSTSAVESPYINQSQL